MYTFLKATKVKDGWSVEITEKRHLHHIDDIDKLAKQLGLKDSSSEVQKEFCLKRTQEQQLKMLSSLQVY